MAAVPDLSLCTNHREADIARGIISDEIIMYTGYQTSKKYPGKLRLIEFFDRKPAKAYRFITNNFRLAAPTIAEIYKQRRQIELFFKWIKQNLKIKSFLGTSENAVMTQIRVAMIHYLLVAYIKFLNRIDISLTEITDRIRDRRDCQKSRSEILDGLQKRQDREF